MGNGANKVRTKLQTVTVGGASVVSGHIAHTEDVMGLSFNVTSGTAEYRSEDEDDDWVPAHGLELDVDFKTTLLGSLRGVGANATVAIVFDIKER